MLYHVPSTNSWQRWQKRRRARRLVSTRYGETSLLKQRLPQIQRWGNAYLTSAAWRTLADAWGRTLRKCSFGLKATIPSSFLSHSLSDAQVSAPAHWEEAAVFSVKPWHGAPIRSGPSGFSSLNWLHALNHSALCALLSVAWYWLTLHHKSPEQMAVISWM